MYDDENIFLVISFISFCWAKRTQSVSDNEAIMCRNSMVNTNPRRAKPRFAGKVTRKNL